MLNLDSLPFELLSNSKRGIERESLRVYKDTGKISQTNHPKSLGEKLTNSIVTVDFSENLIELVSPPFSNYKVCFEYLNNLTSYISTNLNDNEILWAGSMPPNVQEDEIKIADFGTSNSAQMKSIYRNGLDLRYGKTMQIISGIHYNFSVSPEFLDCIPDYYPHLHDGSTKAIKSAKYFHMMRKFYQTSWLLPYLFGCSPVCSLTTVKNKPSFLEKKYNAYVGKFATSLRMSNLGYQSPAQKDLVVSCRNVNEYVRDLLLASDTNFKDFEKIGIKNNNNELQQLNTSIIQIENEYYNILRPKQITKMGERPACALLNRGVEYLEVRLLDVDIFSPIGISNKTAKFMDVFLIYCLLSDYIKYDHNKIIEASNNFEKVATYGRKENLILKSANQDISFKDWSLEVLTDCLNVAKSLDALNDKKDYQNIVKEQISKINNPNLTPSARLLNEVEKSGLDYNDWVLSQSKKHTEFLKNFKVNNSLKNRFDDEVLKSFKSLEKLEQPNNISIEDYIEAYYLSACFQNVK